LGSAAFYLIARNPYSKREWSKKTGGGFNNFGKSYAQGTALEE
jgi:hypothetical protein